MEKNQGLKVFGLRMLTLLVILIWIGTFVGIVIVYPCLFFGDSVTERYEAWQAQGNTFPAGDMEAWQAWLDSKPLNARDYGMIYIPVFLVGVVVMGLLFKLCGVMLGMLGNYFSRIGKQPGILECLFSFAVLGILDGSAVEWISDVQGGKGGGSAVYTTEERGNRQIKSVKDAVFGKLEETAINMGGNPTPTGIEEPPRGYYAGKAYAQEQLELGRKQDKERKAKEKAMQQEIQDRKQRDKENRERKQILEELQKLNKDKK